MFKRIIFSSFLALSAVWSYADDGIAQGAEPEQQVQAPAQTAAESSAAIENSSSSIAVVSSSSVVEPEAPKGREVPVRYWVNGDSAELEAIFVKIENDTVYLKKPTEAEQKQIDKIVDEQDLALQESNGQQVEESEEDDEVEIKRDTAVIMTDAVKDSMRRNHASDDSRFAGVSLFVFIADGGDCARVGDVFGEHGLDIVHGT